MSWQNTRSVCCLAASLWKYAANKILLCFFFEKCETLSCRSNFTKMLLNKESNLLIAVWPTPIFQKDYKRGRNNKTEIPARSLTCNKKRKEKKIIKNYMKICFSLIIILLVQLIIIILRFFIFVPSIFKIRTSFGDQIAR